ncbi:S-adenosyl-L-methionine-dependent methyltransferase [Mytilinidion resinicola]|uniref:S-adenosyl-L-methionine-dependent methyltransferase n=1 Tax=Mytilinidion resinicola TaxID=574789 RepID=A0A6A6YFB7_9PEZI|nr:S-adenosyl-L-methionine-dependent methyltransferase [Mytilinidion resinicola]KAF2806714.1 S-adenosyl-L-methionine-dependent methyltransferase [Mytilinidion resinicola]
MAPSDVHPAPDAQSLASTSGDSGVQVASDWSSAHQQNPASATTTHDEDDRDNFDDAEPFDDNDSAFDDGPSLEDDTFTLNSSIRAYRIENGRSYHAYREGAYWGPNDEKAQDILDMAHHMYLLTLNNALHLAPLRDPKRILDVGTGTGIWAIDVAEQYPTAAITGSDLSPIQPEWVPPNCVFEVDDFTQPWLYGAAVLDFVHIRELFGSVPDWDAFFAQAHRALKPGGWIEVVEHSVQPVSDDDTVDADHFFTLWGNTVIEMGERFGKSFTIWNEAKERLERAGFVDVVEVRYKWPMNGWSRDERLKRIGLWNQYRLHNGVEGFMLRLLTQAGGWSVARAQVFLAQMRAAIKDEKTHAYLPGTVVYGRKPL